MRPITLQDLELIERVRAGQTEAFCEIVAKYQDRIFNTCWRICGHLEDARDLTQEAFLRVFKGLSTFREESGFYTWIFRIAVNLALSHRRKMKKRREVSLDGQAAPTGTQAESLARRMGRRSEPSATGRMEQAETLARVSHALHELDDDHRAVVVLRDIEGFDYHEIGAILDVPPGTVKSRLHRARSELRRLLGPTGEVEPVWNRSGNG